MPGSECLSLCILYSGVHNWAWASWAYFPGFWGLPGKRTFFLIHSVLRRRFPGLGGMGPSFQDSGLCLGADVFSFGLVSRSGFEVVQGGLPRVGGTHGGELVVSVFFLVACSGGVDSGMGLGVW